MYNYVHMNNFRTYYLHVLLRQKSLYNSLLNVNCRKKQLLHANQGTFIYITDKVEPHSYHTEIRHYLYNSLHILLSPPLPLLPSSTQKEKKVEHEIHYVFVGMESEMR